MEQSASLKVQKKHCGRFAGLIEDFGYEEQPKKKTMPMNNIIEFKLQQLMGQDALDGEHKADESEVPHLDFCSVDPVTDLKSSSEVPSTIKAILRNRFKAKKKMSNLNNYLLEDDSDHDNAAAAEKTSFLGGFNTARQYKTP